MEALSPCPCTSGSTYGDCCLPIHNNTALANTAEQLMRSRYSAYALKNEQYLLDSWHEENRPESISFEDEVKWASLKIVSKLHGLATDDHGTVHFKARYKIAGKAYKLEENSQFFKINGRWYYHSAI